MLLRRALRLQPGQVVTFVGAGGKTSALRQLSRELTPSIPTLITTTTRFGLDQFSGVANHVVDDGRLDLALVVEKLQSGGLVLWTGPADEGQHKWKGILPQRIDALKSSIVDLGAIVLVEGDGARQRLIKAPARHEPVIPKSSDMVVGVAGMGALGEALDERIAHRPQRVAAVLSSELGQSLTADQLAELMTSARAGLKAIPPTAEFRLLLNGAAEVEPQTAAELAQSCLRRSIRVRAVVVANLASGEPVKWVAGRIGGVLLAAGGASRMGGVLKQARSWRGKPLALHVLDVARAAGLDPIVVIVGQEGDQVRAALASSKAQIIENPEWSEGQSTSMKLGLQQLDDSCEAVVFLLADMPLVRAETIEQLIQAHRRSLAPIVAPRAEGRFGNPVLFDRSAFSELSRVSGDQGGKAIFGQFEVEAVAAGPEVLFDVDTEQDWQELEDR